MLVCTLGVVCASLYNILRKDVEQDTLSQASMPLAPMPKTLAFAALLPPCTTYCASSAFLCKKIVNRSQHKKHIKPSQTTYFLILDTLSCLMRVFVGPASTFGSS